MTSDSLKTARAVRQPIKNKDDIGASFDAMSYGKGASVLWMFENWIGAEKFRKGVSNYLRKYSFRTANATNFLAELQAVSDPAVSKAFGTFLDQPGTPLVTAKLKCVRNEAPKLKLSQSRFVPAGSKASAAQTWHLPICVAYGRGKHKASQCVLLVKQQQTIELDKMRNCPTWLTANADAVGYYRTAYGKGMLRKLLSAGRKRLSVKERVGLIGDMEALVRANKVSIGDTLSLVPRLMRDKSRHVIESAVSIVTKVKADLVPRHLRPRFARFIRRTFGPRARALGWKPRAKEPKETRILRNKLVPLVARRGADRALIRQAKKLADQWLNTRTGIDKDLISVVLATAAHHGDQALYDRVHAALAKEKDSNTRRRLIGTLSAFRQQRLVERNLKLVMGKDINLREGRPLLSGPLARPETRVAAFAFLKTNLDKLLEKLPPFVHYYTIYSGAAFCDDAGYKNVKAFFTPRLKDINNGVKALAQTLERVQLCTAFKKAQQPAVIKFLRRH